VVIVSAATSSDFTGSTFFNNPRASGISATGSFATSLRVITGFDSFHLVIVVSGVSTILFSAGVIFTAGTSTLLGADSTFGTSFFTGGTIAAFG
jgi:hypothetical protein